MTYNTKNGNPGRYNASLPTVPDGSGAALAVDSSGRLITGASAPGTGATNLGKAEDSVHASGDVGIEMLTKRTDTAASSAGTDGDYATLNTDSTGHAWVREGFAPAYEDNTNSKAIVEHRYTYGRATADTQIKASAGFVHTLSIAPLTATPTAGLMTVYDNTAESGTVIYAEWVFATDVGHTITLDVSCGTGIYIGFDATLANVQATVSYR